MEIVARLILAAILAGAALSKLAAPGAGAAAMRTYGFRSPASRWGALVFVVVAELVLAVGLAAGSEEAAYGAAALMTLFALSLGSALMRGKAGAPCACFGGDSKVSGLAAVRDVVLAVAFATVGLLP